jgi:hypothetical protein
MAEPVWDATKGWIISDESTCPSASAPQAISETLNKATKGKPSQYATVSGHHEVYHSFLHYYCVHCTKTWHEQPFGNFVRIGKIVDMQQVYLPTV